METDALYSFGTQPEGYYMIDSVYLILSNVVTWGLVISCAIPTVILLYILAEIRANPKVIFDTDSYAMMVIEALSYDDYLDIETDEEILKEHQKDIFILFLKVLVVALLTQSPVAVGAVTTFYALMYNLDPLLFKYYAANYWEEIPQ